MIMTRSDNSLAHFFYSLSGTLCTLPLYIQSSLCWVSHFDFVSESFQVGYSHPIFVFIKSAGNYTDHLIP